MITTKRISLKNLIKWSGESFLWLLMLNGLIALLYYFNVIDLKIPWLPVSVIGTAVAFYIGFKNNNSYDRLWEARKIWGGIVNESRSWAMMLDGFVSDTFTHSERTPEDIHKIKERLIYRHIAWLYAHRSQLLIPTAWEQVSRTGRARKEVKFFKENFGIGLLNDEITEAELKQLLPKEEYSRMINHSNTATQIINEQSRDLRDLRKENLIDDFRHMSLTDVLRSFYTLQGKNERIKKFPLPRQYSAMSQYFVWIFILLLPFSMIPELMDVGNWGLWLAIPITSLIGWIYRIMETVGDYSENPFQGLMNDIPMMSLCRTIEIDLRDILGETDLPPVIKSVNGILN